MDYWNPEGSAAGIAPTTRPSMPEGDSSEFLVDGKPFGCPICKGTRFWSRRGLLNTRGLTLLDVDWMNRGATQVICSGCGYMLWFADRPA